MEASRIQEYLKGLFPDVLGIRLEEVTPERVTARLEGRDELCTVPGVIHGGVLMAFADTLGAVGTTLNLPEGASTTTVESKTNFLAAASSKAVLRGECIPLKVGRRVMTWQTRISSDDGKLVALVTQTQMVLEGAKEPSEIMASLFAGKSMEEQKALLATLERAGANLYRGWADGENAPEVRTALLAAADREEENAEVLERTKR